MGALAAESGESPAPIVGEWNLNDGRKVIAHDDETAEIVNPRTGVREAVGEWMTQDFSSGECECTFTWKGGNRHVMKLAADGGSMRGNLHAHGRLAARPVSAERVPSPSREDGEGAEQISGFFGSTSPSGVDGGMVAEEAVYEEDEHPAGDEESYLSEKSVAVQGAPIERTATQATLLAKDAHLSGRVRFEPQNGNIGNWADEGSSVSWSVAHLKPGKYNVSMEHSVGLGKHGGRFEISTDSTKASGFVRTTGGWKSFRRKPLGSIEIKDTDTELVFTITDVEPGAYLMNVRFVELRRQ